MVKAGLFTALAVIVVVAIGYYAYESQRKPQLTDFELANAEALADEEGDDGDSGETYYCWAEFIGGLAWPRQCPSCVRLPFATGVSSARTCTVK